MKVNACRAVKKMNAHAGGENHLSSAPCVRILGVDASLRSTGFGLIEARAQRISAVEFGVVKSPGAWPLSRCLARLQNEFAEIIERTGPDVAAIEGVFFCRNVRTAVALGEARGVIIASCAVRGIPVHEYSPRRVKQAVVGFGGADKRQVAMMVVGLLNLAATPKEDAADALAVAISHAHSKKMNELQGIRAV